MSSFVGRPDCELLEPFISFPHAVLFCFTFEIDERRMLQKDKSDYSESSLSLWLKAQKYNYINSSELIHF